MSTSNSADPDNVPQLTRRDDGPHSEWSPAFSGVLEEITALSERELQSRIIEPLLRNMGFKNVLDNSGPNEQGKDVIATRENFGRTDLYAIQIKKFRPSGKHGKKDSLGGLLDQLRSAVFELVLDPSTNKRRAPNRVVFITPYPIHPSLREQFEERADLRELRGLTIIDGPQLLDLIREHLPEAISSFSLQSQYRLRLAADVNRISEAAVAFETTREIDLNHIYVDASMALGQRNVYRLAAIRIDKLTKKQTKSRRVSKEQADALDLILADWIEQPFAQIPRKQQSRLEVKNGEVTLEVKCLFEVIVNKSREAVDSISILTSQGSSATACTKAVSIITSVGRKIERLRSDKDFRSFWPTLVVMEDGKPEPESISFSADVLVKVGLPIFVLGAPGSGKTTLLKRISQAAASQREGILPVFLPMVLLADASPGGIIRACSKQMSLYGFRPSGKPVAEAVLRATMASSGLWMCLDGLDEAGMMAKDALRAVEAIATEYPKCRIILSSRDTAQYGEWAGAFVVRLNQFSDAQLNEFISKWFSTQPSAQVGLQEWLAHNPGMKDVARTPLIAASLCSLYQAHADMPQTEVELYQRRFELLLGRWEQAKGITPMQSNVRKRYLYFLRVLAFRLHKAERRAVPNTDVVDLARRYYVPAIHGDASGLVQDCLNRGLLEQETGGRLSLGHLTYQEFLAAEHLISLNPAAEIWEHLLEPWWKNTFDFYAALKWDISTLLVLGTRKPVARIIKQRLAELARLAPLTPPELLNAIKVDPRIEV